MPLTETMMDLDKKALELKGAKKPFCWATVVRAEGSAPRHAGAKMLVTEDAQFGTVGGGGLEHETIMDARRAIRKRTSELKHYELSEAGIQPCGGAVDIFLDVILPPRRAVVFGAGHVSEKLCPLLAELGFEVTLVDERIDRIDIPEGASERLPLLPRDAIPTIAFNDELHIVVLTHNHVHDEEIVRSCLGRTFRYLGLISSRKKWALFKARYLEEGFTEQQTARISTPVGLDIGAETPFEIAVAIAAEIIQLHAKPDDFRSGIGHFKELCGGERS
jgi:xanthine dehydrogenase accessory factor